MEIINTIALSLSGLLLLTAGSFRLINPIKNYLKNSGIRIENEVNLLNEVRGVSSLMMSAGVIILLGTILPSLTLTSFVVATLLFFGFAIGRTFSIISDGKPNKKIITGLISELFFGTLNVTCLIISMI